MNPTQPSSLFVGLLFGLCLGISQSAHAQVDTLKLGGAEVRVPRPKGFPRVDQKGVSGDRVDILAIYGDAGDVAALSQDQFAQKRNFNVQVFADARYPVFTLEDLADRKRIRDPAPGETEAKQLDTFLKAVTDPKTGAVRVTNDIKEDTKEIRNEIPFGGIFSFSKLETEDSVGSLWAYRRQPYEYTPGVTQWVCIAQCDLRVRERLVFLNVTSPLNNRDDVKWAKQALINWRDAIIRANAKK